MSHRTKDHLPTASTVISEIARSNEFLERRDKEVGRVALAGAAWAIAERHIEENNGYETPATLQQKLIGTLPAWLSAQVTLDQHRHEMSRQEKHETLEPVVELNHILREMIDREVYTTMSEAMTFAGEALQRMKYQPNVINYASQQLRGILDGMRHEIASESVLIDLPGVDDVRSGDGVDDELKGKDIWVMFDDGHEVGIDIKSTERAAREANADLRHSDYLAVWSGFDWEDFGDNLVPDRETIAHKRHHIASTVAYLRRNKKEYIA